SRAFMAGLIGAAANVGYMLVGFVGLGLAALLTPLGNWLTGVGLPPDWVERLVGHQGWRVMVLPGTPAALLALFLRLSVRAAGRWREEEGRGATASWATHDLLAVVIGALGPALMIYLWAWEHPFVLRLFGSLFGLALVTAGYLYPVARYLQRQAGAGFGRSSWQPTDWRLLLAACLSGGALLGAWGSTPQ